MPVNVGEIVDTIQACVAESPTDQELAQLSGAITNIEAGDVYSVACAALLPDATENTGRWVFVEDISAYRYSDGFEWTNCYDTTFRIARNLLYSAGFSGQAAIGDGTMICRSSPVIEYTSSANWCYIGTGNYNTYAIKIDGALWAWGTNITGAAGNNCASGTVCSPVQEYSSSTIWTSVNGGDNSAGAIKSDGTLWNWGANCCGSLGYNNLSNAVSSPIQEISSSTDWCSISLGQDYRGAVKTDNTLWLWGRNTLGQLGTPGNTLCHRSSPTQEISSSTNWYVYSAGNYHSNGIKSDGTLWGWGNNNCGQLGINSLISYSSPIQEITSSTNWSNVSGARCYTLALKTDGTLWGWGMNSCRSIGNGTIQVPYSSPIQEISSSTNWCLVCGSKNDLKSLGIKTDGTLWFWGNNNYGQLMLNNTNAVYSPTQEFTSADTWCAASTYGVHTAAIIQEIKGFNEP